MRYAPCEVVVLPDKELPEAPAKTDFTRIYVRRSLDAREREVAEKHERAHILCGHGWRRPSKSLTDDSHAQAWRIATEMEIAINIYDDDDEAVIMSPLSRLHGGYTRHSLPGLPSDITMAEGIYEWLLSQPQEKSAGCKCCDGAEQEKPEDAAQDADAITKIISDAKEKIEEYARSLRSQAAVIADAMRMKNRPPNLVAELDAALRVRTERIASYRRPSRRHDDTIVLHGVVHAPLPPLVEIYVDRSGSFTPQKTASAQIVLDMMLRRYGATIRHDTWYFGNDRVSDKDDIRGGNTPYCLVTQMIHEHAPSIAIIITDDDDTGEVTKPRTTTKTIVIPIGCSQSRIARSIGAVDVIFGYETA